MNELNDVFRPLADLQIKEHSQMMAQYLFMRPVVNFINNIFAPKSFKPLTQLCNFWRQNFVLKMHA